MSASRARCISAGSALAARGPSGNEIDGSADGQDRGGLGHRRRAAVHGAEHLEDCTSLGVGHRWQRGHLVNSDAIELREDLVERYGCVRFRRAQGNIQSRLLKAFQTRGQPSFRLLECEIDVCLEASDRAPFGHVGRGDRQDAKVMLS